MSVSGRLVSGPIHPAALLAEVSAPRNGAGLLFLGLVRATHDGRAVNGIEYSAYEAMAERELSAIADECAAEHGLQDLAIVHRLGELALQEAPAHRAALLFADAVRLDMLYDDDDALEADPLRDAVGSDD